MRYRVVQQSGIRRRSNAVPFSPNDQRLGFDAAESGNQLRSGIASAQQLGDETTALPLPLELWARTGIRKLRAEAIRIRRRNRAKAREQQLPEFLLVEHGEIDSRRIRRLQPQSIG